MIGFLLLLTLNLVAAKEWALDDSTRTTIVAGVGSSDSSTVKGIIASSANGVGAYVQNYDGNAWDNHPVQAGLLLDSAATFSGKTRVVASTGKVYISNDFGETFTPVANLVGTSQCATIFGKGKESIALVGAFALKNGDSTNVTEAVVSTNGVAYSTDDGKSFTVSTVPVGYTRYGAFPTESTWYVSSGIWGDDPATANKQHAFSSRLSVDSKGYLSVKEQTGEKKPLKSAGTPTGWFGAVSKTTDGGKTWTQVLSTNLETEYLYFNGISCASETQCVVVAEGDKPTGGSLTTAYTTFDGGVTWAASLVTDDESLMGAKFINEQEVWLLGSAQSKRQINGQFYRSTDGGKSFTLAQALTNCLALDLDMNVDGTAGYAACCNSSGSACSAAVYK